LKLSKTEKTYQFDVAEVMERLGLGKKTPTNGITITQSGQYVVIMVQTYGDELQHAEQVYINDL